MNSPSETPTIPAENLEAPAPGLAVVGAFSSLKAAGDRGLVVLSMGLPYWVYAVDGRYQLCVSTDAESAVRHQLDRFERESVDWPPRAPDDNEALGARLLPPLIFGLILILIHITALGPQGELLHGFGRMDAIGVIGRGEWWRAFTALTLHADAGHLVANLAAGAFFAWFASRRLGSGVAWMLITLAGGLGNVLTAWFYFPGDHLSIGASTAVFGALGLLIGRPLAGHTGIPAPVSGSKRAALIRVAAALVLLALLGAGGGRSDVLAHALGFAAGAAFAWLPARLQHNAANHLPVQQLCALAALGLIAGAWWIAWLHS